MTNREREDRLLEGRLSDLTTRTILSIISIADARKMDRRTLLRKFIIILIGIWEGTKDD